VFGLHGIHSVGFCSFIGPPFRARATKCGLALWAAAARRRFLSFVLDPRSRFAEFMVPQRKKAASSRRSPKSSAACRDARRVNLRRTNRVNGANNFSNTFRNRAARRIELRLESCFDVRFAPKSRRRARRRIVLSLRLDPRRIAFDQMPIALCVSNQTANLKSCAPMTPVELAARSFAKG